MIYGIAVKQGQFIATVTENKETKYIGQWRHTWSEANNDIACVGGKALPDPKRLFEKLKKMGEGS